MHPIVHEKALRGTYRHIDDVFQFSPQRKNFWIVILGGIKWGQTGSERFFSLTYIYIFFSTYCTGWLIGTPCNVCNNGGGNGGIFWIWGRLKMGGWERGALKSVWNILGQPINLFFKFISHSNSKLRERASRHIEEFSSGSKGVFVIFKFIFLL